LGGNTYPQMKIFRRRKTVYTKFAMRQKAPEPIERVTLKLPKSLALYFRKAFPHGQRSKFVADCIMDYRHSREIESMEDELRKVGKNRDDQ